MSTAILPLLPPPLACTQAIPHCCHHQPLSLPRQHRCYLANSIATTTATMPSLASTLTCIAWHTQATLLPSLSLCIFFSSFYFILVISLHFKLVQDSVGCNTATATSPHACTGYPIAIISPFWGTPAAPLHLPLCALWVDMSHCCSPYLVPPSKKKSKSIVPFISNFPLTHTPHHLTHLAPQGQLDKFFFSFLLFPSYLEPVQDNSAHNITAVPSPHAHEGHPCSPTTTPLAACKRICHWTALSPMQLADPVVPNLVTTATLTTLPPL